MTNKEILKKCFKKIEYKWENKLNASIYEEVLIWKNEDKCLCEWAINDNYYKIIFSHEFAKAFWGDELIKTYPTGEWTECKHIKKWQYHLQQMILEENPLKYIEKFLGENNE